MDYQLLKKMGVQIGYILLMIGILSAQETKEKIEFDYGMRLYREGLYDLAAIQFNHYVNHYPLSPNAAEAQLFKAESFYLLEQYQDAQKAFTVYLIQYPSAEKGDLAQLRIGECFGKMGKPNEAIESFSRVYQYYPSSVHGLTGLYRSAQIALEQNREQYALVQLQLLLKKSIHGELRSKGLFLLTEVYKQLKDYENAIVQLELIIQQKNMKSDREKAYFELAQLYERLGYWEDAEGAYKKILESESNTGIIGIVNYRLGILSELQCQYENAKRHFKRVSEGSTDQEIQAHALYHLGILQYHRKAFQNSYSSFQKAEKYYQDRYQKKMSEIWTGRCQEALNNHNQALQTYQHVLDEIDWSTIDSTICKTGLLLLANIYNRLGQYISAIDNYKKYLKLFPEDQLADRILLKIGCIYQKKLQLYYEAIRTYNKIVEDVPASSVIPEARFWTAECLMESDRITEAIEVLHRLIKLYPENHYYDAAKKLLQVIDRDYITHYQQNIVELTHLLAQSYGKSDQNRFYLLGKMYFSHLKRYAEAVEQFHACRNQSSDPIIKSESLYYIGRCYEYLYQKEKNKAFFDSSKTIYSAVLSDTSNFNNSLDAGIRLADLLYEKNKTDASDVLHFLLKTYPNSSNQDIILSKLGLLKLHQDSLQISYRFFNELIKKYPESKNHEIALGQCGHILYRLGRYTEADSLFKLYHDQYPDGPQVPGILVLQSEIKKRWGRLDQAVVLLDVVNCRYRFEPWQNRTIKNLGKLYLKKGDYQSAIKFYSHTLARDSLCLFAHSVGLLEDSCSNRTDYLSDFAKAYLGLNDLRMAKNTYFKLLKENFTQESRNQVWIALARIAEMDKNNIRASNYLKHAVAIYPDDSTFLSLGMFQFRLGKYDDAIVSYNRALELSKSDIQKGFLSSRIAIAMLRKGQIPQAQVRINVYQKTYKNDPQFEATMAELFLEEGKAFFNEKEFESALESFQKVIAKYRRTVFAPEAEFEMGRTYLITNRIEKALDVLTGIIQKYPDHPILARVYVNLGDHYFRSQQFDNAISAFKKVIESYETDMENTQMAIRYLIRVYDSIRMWDAALALTRKYINQYPKAEDLIQKKVQIGLFYMKLKSYHNAITSLKEVKLEADSETEAEIQYWIGKCYHDMGDLEQAIFEFLKVKYLSKPTKLPWGSTALYEAGMAYLKLEKPEEAVKLFEKVVQFEGATSDMGRIARKRIEDIETDNMESDQ